MKEVYKKFIRNISWFIPDDRIYTDDLRCLAWGTDAGFYRHIPQVVVRSKDEKEVSRLLAEASKLGLPVTFRAAGTSLSGQTTTDSILIVAGKNWEQYSINEDASEITLQPGIVGRKVDEILRPYGKTFSPDPASKNSAMVGGIVMNNASGMSCGTHANSDKVMKSMRIVFADGTILDTGSEESRAAFRASHPDFLKGIEAIRDKVLADEALVKRIKHKYAIKNVTGLNIYPFVEHTDPFDIITHLMVGSEGTLGFASEFTMTTGHLYPFSASAMLYFTDLRRACECIVALKDSPVECAEMLDKKSLASVHDTTGDNLTAILVRTSADSEAELAANIAAMEKVLEDFELFVPAKFTSDPEENAKYWAIRSGVFPVVAGTRPLGTTVIIEDVAFHIEDLPNATCDLEQMLQEHGYDDSCIYGHALEGNYHFIIAQSFNTEADVKQYRDLMDEITKLVVDKYDGSLKAEHGTGRNMAPFVVKEWGEKAFEIMKEVKALFDPQNILNPGVIFNDDPDCFVKSFKPLPLTNGHVDKCMECGFCEVNCVSCGFTMSSRQRIVVQREITRLKASGEDDARLKRLEKQYAYYGDATCAADGLCSTSCPMKINTGDLTHDIRNAKVGTNSFTHKVGAFAADNLPAIRAGIKLALHGANAAHAVLRDKGVEAVGKAVHAVGGPLWTPSLPKAYSAHKFTQAQSEKKVVYFPSCLNQTMGKASKGVKTNLVDEVVAFLNKAGWEVIFPEGMKKMCCGMIWESKGMPDIADRKTAELEAALLAASEGGKYPVICDQSPCLHRMKDHMTKVKPLELMEFIHDYVADSLEFHPTDEPVAIHLTCSTRHMKLDQKLLSLARRCSTNVVLPEGVGCCGFAGDKGFNQPELNQWALRKLKENIEKANVQRGFSNSRTCEIGLTTHSGVPYQSLIYLINECTTVKQ
ncbi:MAG: FAD-binding and (Fe-S)-binding domain-containing protein [Bacteroidales bacterium]|nr:FAD-binding and (Fe-S)-binding domain-containing protein [Bacteroidales bacterium]